MCLLIFSSFLLSEEPLLNIKTSESLENIKVPLLALPAFGFFLSIFKTICKVLLSVDRKMVCSGVPHTPHLLQDLLGPYPAERALGIWAQKSPILVPRHSLVGPTSPHGPVGVLLADIQLSQHFLSVFSVLFQLTLLLQWSWMRAGKVIHSGRDCGIALKPKGTAAGG